MHSCGTSRYQFLSAFCLASSPWSAGRRLPDWVAATASAAAAGTAHRPSDHTRLTWIDHTFCWRVRRCDSFRPFGALPFRQQELLRLRSHGASLGQVSSPGVPSKNTSFKQSVGRARAPRASHRRLPDRLPRCQQWRHSMGRGRRRCHSRSRCRSRRRRAGAAWTGAATRSSAASVSTVPHPQASLLRAATRPALRAQIKRRQLTCAEPDPRPPCLNCSNSVFLDVVQLLALH